tara:strand:- start:73 stop:444 length:372 start_codon:yes stop_codon:yes gene_type:complete
METRKQRTPQQLIAEQTAKLERMHLRQAQATAKSNPALSPLMDEKADITKEIREAKKLLGDGPQSANVRIEKHEAWILKISAEAEDADLVLRSAESRLEQINDEITSTLALLVSTSKEISIEA